MTWQDRSDRAEVVAEAAVATGRLATGDIIDRERSAVALYPSFLDWMGFFFAVIVVPRPGTTTAGDDDSGIGASAGAVIPHVGRRRSGSDNQDDGDYYIGSIVDT